MAANGHTPPDEGGPEHDALTAKRARKIQLQREYLARKRARATPDELEAMRAKQRAYSRKSWNKDLTASRAKHAARAMRRYHADPETHRATLRAAWAKHGDKWKAAARAKYRADPERRARHKAECLSWHQANREAVKAYKHKRHAKNRERFNARSRQYQADNRERLAAWHRAYRRRNAAAINATILKWRAANPDYVRNRYRSDPAFRAMCRLRVRIVKVVTAQGARKNDGTIPLIGCSPRELLAHLEAQFTAGMSWENFGAWHIDHEKPCATFDLTDPQQQRACFHYTNLRPLWAADNLARPRPRRS